MADISNVVNISILQEPALAKRANVNNVMIVTSDNSFLNSNKRYAIYKNIADVANDFGTNSQAYEFASSFFSTTPNPINVGGSLYIGYWRKVDETVPASAGVLTGGEIIESIVIDTLQQVTDGQFKISIDGTERDITGLSFNTVSKISDIVSIIDTAVTSWATVTFSNNRFIFTSKTTGATSAVLKPTDFGSGTFIANILGLIDGAVETAGAASSVLTAESMLQGATELKAQSGVYGMTFIDKGTTADNEALADFAQSNKVLIYEVFSDAVNLEKNVITNVVWKLKLAKKTRYRMLYSKSGNRKMAVSYMARMHTVNFSSEKTSLSMQVKELSVPAEENILQTEIAKCGDVGLDLYTTIAGTTSLLTSGANDYTDNVYNLIAYENALQIDIFNVLKGTSTKIPQTERGVNLLLNQCRATTAGFVKAEVFAPGTWTSPDTFGDIEAFKSNIEITGFYFEAGLLADQPQSERQQRKAPVIRGAVKNAGAVHQTDIIVNLNL